MFQRAKYTRASAPAQNRRMLADGGNGSQERKDIYMDGQDGQDKAGKSCASCASMFNLILLIKIIIKYLINFLSTHIIVFFLLYDTDKMFIPP